MQGSKAMTTVTKYKFSTWGVQRIAVLITKVEVVSETDETFTIKVHKGNPHNNTTRCESKGALVKLFDTRQEARQHGVRYMREQIESRESELAFAREMLATLERPETLLEILHD